MFSIRLSEAKKIRKPDCGVGYKDKKHSLIGQVSNGRIWRENVLDNGTEAMIGLFHERNVIQT